jgi:hypothetical protein
VEAAATAEQTFSKIKPQSLLRVWSSEIWQQANLEKPSGYSWSRFGCGSACYSGTEKDLLKKFKNMVIQKWTQLRKRRYWKDPKNISKEKVFFEKVPQFFLKIEKDSFFKKKIPFIE